MIIGVPKEHHRHEHRVGLTPWAAGRLAEAGHEVLVERGAGEEARFSDWDYQQTGARIVYGADELHGRSELLCRVGETPPAEVGLLRKGVVICSFHHLAVSERRVVEALMAAQATLVGWEVVRDGDGGLPVLFPLSEMAGRMAVHLAAQLLQNESGGRGILLANVPGVPPPTVLIVGAGAVGASAARAAVAAGAHTIVSDVSMPKLRELARELDGRVVTVLAGPSRLERYTAIADVLIGAVLEPGRRTPAVVSEAMVRGMKAGSVIIDVAIDQGGCVETSRPTSLADPTFMAHGVLHYCVPNFTSNIARTASRALSNSALPYVQALASGVETALAGDPGLAAGVLLFRGHAVHPGVADAFGLPAAELPVLLAEAALGGEA